MIPDGAEQIDDLIYLPNPDYPYPVPLAQPPHFWMTEQTGKLEVAVERYFGGDALTADDLRLIRAYLRQYIARALMAGDANRNALLREVETLRSHRDIERFADDLADYGVEPF